MTELNNFILIKIALFFNVFCVFKGIKCQKYLTKYLAGYIMPPERSSQGLVAYYCLLQHVTHIP